MSRLIRSNIVAILTSLTMATTSVAQVETDAATALSLELNGTEQTEGGCRLTFLVRNTLQADLAVLSLETVVLTTDGAVERVTLFDFGRVPTMRPRVRQFDLAGLECDGLGQVLINGIAACEGDGIMLADCQTALTLSSRTEVGLIG